MKSDVLEVVSLRIEEYLAKKVDNNDFFRISGEQFVLKEINIKKEDFIFEVKFLKLNMPPIMVGTDSQGIIKYASIDRGYLDNMTEEKATELKEIFMLAKDKVQEFIFFAIENNIK